ncbi:MAG: oxygenase MpaB family protein, partial [Polyangiaceae bacterium]
AMLERGLERGSNSVEGAPEALRELFSEIEHVPAWVDARAIERGGELLFRSGWFGGLVLGISLLYGYASPGGNKPLVFSGRLSEQAPRRLRETSRFVEATCSPNGLGRGGAGLAITVKVRLMHAQVRKMILQSGRWNEDKWALPINQHDMAGTSILFSLAPIESLRSLGFEPDADEAHLYMQLWRYSGYLIGVDQEILPTSEHDARRLKDIISSTEGPPDDDSRMLSRALFSAGPRSIQGTPEVRARAARMADIGEGLLRGVMGDEVSDGLGVPSTRYRHAIHPVRAVVERFEKNRLLRRGLRGRSIDAGRKYWRAAIQRDREPILFSLPGELLGIAG